MLPKYQARPVKRESLLILVQLLPPSSERYSPPDFLVGTSAYTRWPSLATATAGRLQSPSGKPLPVIRDHVRPPSCDRKMPLPGPSMGPYTLQGGRRVFQVAANRMSGL